MDHYHWLSAGIEIIKRYDPHGRIYAEWGEVSVGTLVLQGQPPTTYFDNMAYEDRIELRRMGWVYQYGMWTHETADK